MVSQVSLCDEIKLNIPVTTVASKTSQKYNQTFPKVTTLKKVEVIIEYILDLNKTYCVYCCQFFCRSQVIVLHFAMKVVGRTPILHNKTIKS